MCLMQRKADASAVVMRSGLSDGCAGGPGWDAADAVGSAEALLYKVEAEAGFLGPGGFTAAVLAECCSSCDQAAAALADGSDCTLSEIMLAPQAAGCVAYCICSLSKIKPAHRLSISSWCLFPLA